MSNGLGISDGILRTEDISWWGWGGRQDANWNTLPFKSPKILYPLYL